MAVLLQYNFTSNLNPSTTASGVSGSAVTAGAGMGVVDRTSSGYASQPEIDCYPPGTSTTNITQAVTNNCYNFITITPDAGKKISLTTLTFNAARGGASTPRGYGVRSSVDSYAASLGNADLATSNPTWTAVSIDLSSAGFQNVTSAITFRIFIYAPTAGNSVDIDDIIVNGTVADATVPTNMQINISDTWKTVTGLQINIGDSWKTVTKVQVNIGDAWKTVFG